MLSLVPKIFRDISLYDEQGKYLRTIHAVVINMDDTFSEVIGFMFLDEKPKE